ncbi:MAG: hypothetical protein FJ096_04340 [Deltaproteobacteria bacterium]|nr:hypothetical protein [Deltaproteobacteria bacterium]
MVLPHLTLQLNRYEYFIVNPGTSHSTKTHLRSWRVSLVAGALTSLLLSQACTIELEVDVCDTIEATLDSIPDAQLDAYINRSLATLEQSEITIDTVWNDPKAFNDYIAELQSAFGCAPENKPAGQVSQYFHDKENFAGAVGWCGPGHFKSWLYSDCMNQACYRHDSCYTRCTGKTSLGCVWNDRTDPCDAVFFSEAETCMGGTRGWTRVIDRAVLFAANRARSIAPSLTCAADMSCPEPGFIGNGPCAYSPDSSTCGECLEKNDPGGACLEAACGGSLDDYLCYPASCNVGPCYGGYNGY